jgi:hypothetical protein
MAMNTFNLSMRATKLVELVWAIGVDPADDAELTRVRHETAYG